LIGYGTSSRVSASKIWCSESFIRDALGFLIPTTDSDFYLKFSRLFQVALIVGYTDAEKRPAGTVLPSDAQVIAASKFSQGNSNPG